MKEIGGYIELDTYSLPLLHKEAIALNCGRNALAYVLKCKNIKKIYIPKFLCKSVYNVCQREHVLVSFYNIDKSFLPIDLCLNDDEWLYIVNYYGQLTNDQILDYKKKYKNIIVDNAQSYFQMPVEGVDTLYTCRKYFGVADGAFLYTDFKLNEVLPIDESYQRMQFILGRYERSANEFYTQYVENNRFFKDEPIKEMSKLTRNLLCGIDYNDVCNKRVNNFYYLHENLKEINQLEVSYMGTFMYPLFIDNADVIRKELQKKKIYIPTLWPDAFEWCSENEIEHKFVQNILPLPIDQRYSTEDMKYIVEEIRKCLN